MQFISKLSVKTIDKRLLKKITASVTLPDIDLVVMKTKYFHHTDSSHTGRDTLREAEVFHIKTSLKNHIELYDFRAELQ